MAYNKSHSSVISAALDAILHNIAHHGNVNKPQTKRFYYSTPISAYTNKDFVYLFKLLSGVLLDTTIENFMFVL